MQVCGEQKRYRHLIQKSSLARGLHATAKYMIAWKTECSSASRNQKKMLKFVKGLMNRQIKGALNIWLEILHDKQRRDRLLRKALMKVKMRFGPSPLLDTRSNLRSMHDVASAIVCPRPAVCIGLYRLAA